MFKLFNEKSSKKLLLDSVNCVGWDRFVDYGIFV